MISRHRWVCVICGEGFTRRSSANRHNQNLHFGNSTIVRPFEYVIGRLNGKFPESKDALLFRRNSNNRRFQNTDPNRLLYTHESSNNDGSHKYFNRQKYNCISKTAASSSQLPDCHYVTSQPFQKMVTKYCKPSDAQKMLRVAYVITFNLGDETFLDDQLKMLVP
jgi:hypothetical protein